MKKSIERWWKRLTWWQRVGFVAGVAGLAWLGRDHLPTSPDEWKEWIEVVAFALTSLGTAAALVNGREEPKEEP